MSGLIFGAPRGRIAAMANDRGSRDGDIVEGYVPGCIGRVVELHGTYYHEHWGFGVFFEARMATEIAALFGRYDSARDGFWTASLEGRVEASIAIDGLKAAEEGAHLRWFIVSDALRGRGVGNRLLDTAVSFCRERGYPSVDLWTFEGLDAARHLYEKAGFRLVGQQRGQQWGTPVTEQHFALKLP
jgi:GNAT superfamily N-acetyltransferase